MNPQIQANPTPVMFVQTGNAGVTNLTDEAGQVLTDESGNKLETN